MQFFQAVKKQYKKASATSEDITEILSDSEVIKVVVPEYGIDGWKLLPLQDPLQVAKYYCPNTF